MIGQMRLVDRLTGQRVDLQQLTLPLHLDAIDMLDQVRDCDGSSFAYKNVASIFAGAGFQTCGDIYRIA